MKPINRAIEKVLAWIANVLLIITTAFLSFIAFTGIIEALRNAPGYTAELNTTALEVRSLGITPESVTEALTSGFKIYAGVYIVLTIIAIVASFTMKSRIFSGVLFLLVSIVVAVFSFGVLLPIYILHFIVAIMLFVRKEEPEYINQNPYVNNGYNDYSNNTTEAQYSQKVDGVNYKTTSNEQEKVDKIEYL